MTMTTLNLGTNVNYVYLLRSPSGMRLFIGMGEESYQHFSASRAAMSRWALVPVLSPDVGISATIWYLSILAALIFIAASIISIFHSRETAGQAREFFN
ncbi:MAG: hypothetical protein ABFS08_05260 [Pseudomonadota bacterium]